MALDFEGEVVEIERDPVLMLRPRGATASLPCPWLFTSRRDGSRVLVVHGEPAEATLLARAFAGTEVSVASPVLPDAAQLQRIRWLAGFRFSRCRAPVEVERDVLEVCARARLLEEVTCYLTERLQSSDRARAGAYALIWHRLLVLADDGSSISDTSLVVAR